VCPWAHGEGHVPPLELEVRSAQLEGGKCPSVPMLARPLVVATLEVSV